MKRLQGKEEPRRVEERRRDRGNEREGYKMRRANLFVRQVCPQISLSWSSGGCHPMRPSLKAMSINRHIPDSRGRGS